MKIQTLIIAAVVSVSQWGFSQSFVNLDFENAVIKTNGLQSPFCVTSNAIPGWTAYVGGTQQYSILYNAVSLSVAAVSLQGTNNPINQPSISGNYFAILSGEFNPSQGQLHTNTAAIGQTGQIPLGVQSLVFWGNIGGLQVTFDGQLLSFAIIGNAANYAIYGADISSYAGQTGQLLFTALPYFNGFGGPTILDNIQFSTVAVPEPTSLSLLGLAGFGFWFGQNRWRSGRRLR